MIRGKVDERRRRWFRRKRHIRQRIRGDAARPRLTVYKSNRYTYAQVIDDDAGRTLATASNREQELRDVPNTVEGCAKIGTALGERLQKQNIDTVVFDRNGYAYHGIVRSIADSVRKAGIKV